MKTTRLNRYIPVSIKNFIDNKLHIYIKYNNKDLSSKIYSLDKEGLIIICDTILRMAGSRDININNLVQIQTTSFHNILHNDYSLYLDYLIQEKIVITDNFYIPGEKSISYKLNEDFIDDLTSIQMENKTYLNRTIKAINETDTKLKVSTKHRNNFKNDFKIDFVAAWNYITNSYINQVPDKKDRVLNKYTKAVLQRKLLEINDKQLFISRSSSNGRITTNLSILNGDYKKFILGYDYSLDIVSSQPSMLNMFINLLKELRGEKSPVISYSNSYLSYEYRIIEKTLGKSDGVRFLEGLKTVKLPSKIELDLWKNLCESGDIYRHFANEVFNITGKKITRQEAKQIFIIVLYSPSKSPNEYKKIFSMIYPTIYKFLNDIKSIAKIKRSHKMLPLLLQGTESFIWIEMILPELDRLDIRYHFIHDSIIIKKKDLDRAEIKITEQFFIAGLNAQISIEDIKTEKKI
jgi:hypothetical protein